MTQPHEKAAAIVENARALADSPCGICRALLLAAGMMSSVSRHPPHFTARRTTTPHPLPRHDTCQRSRFPAGSGGRTQRARPGSELYSKEELIAELGAAFLSNEAGILDSVRFENSAAYLRLVDRSLKTIPA